MAESIRKLVQYGGAVFTANCPKCGEDLETPKDMSVNEFTRQMNDKENPKMLGECVHCLSQEMEFVGFLIP